MSASSLLRFAIALAVIGYGVAASAQAKPHYQISGTLVSSSDGSSVSHGHLAATLATEGRPGRRRFPAPTATGDTDDNGRFLISLPSAGRWSLAASARGFTRQEYQEHGEFSTAVVLTSAAPAIQVRFALSPEASIVGVVLDEAGEAVRKAQVSLMRMASPTPGQAERAATQRASTTTDDRGEYEFDGLSPGGYKVCVTTRPWYAAVAQRGSADSSSLDPSLDVTYAPTWFPGVDDPATAEILALNAGDRREADLRLLPIPAVHLLITPKPGANETQDRRFLSFPLVQRVDSGGGGEAFVPVALSRNALGQIDVGGLSPGLYQIRMADPGEEDGAAVVKVNSGSAQTFDPDSVNEARVTMHLDGVPEGETGSVEVSLVDPSSGSPVLDSGGRGGFGGGFRRVEQTPEGNRVVEVPPGRYEVVLRGRPDLYLAGVSAKGAQVTGRMITLGAGDSSLAVHVVEGRAHLTGIASFKGKPSVGAMVVLVPATLGNPGSIAIVRRDQSNTDGSFDLPEVIPGQYILIAIDHGWDVNWSDALTLNQYLTQGVAVNLTSTSVVKQNVVAQAP